MDKEEFKTVVIMTIIAILVIFVALSAGDSSSDAPADPACVGVGNC